MKKLLLLFVLAIIGLGSCKKDETKSDKNDILSANIVQNGSSFIFDTKGVIDKANATVTFSSKDVLEYPIELKIAFEVSPNAKVMNAEDKYNFTSDKGIVIKIEAENGAVQSYVVLLDGADSNPDDLAEVLSAKVKENTSPYDFDENAVVLKDDARVVFNSDDVLVYPITLDLEFEISPGATIKDEPEMFTFEDQTGIELTVVSKSGIEKKWMLATEGSGEDFEQIANSKFDTWYKVTAMSGKEYYEPGVEGAQAVWSTPNMAITLTGDPSVTPLMDGDNFAGAVVKTEEVPIYTVGAGALFTGIFDFSQFDPNDPSAATKFGIPFTSKPKSMLIQFKYVPGETNTDMDGNVLPYADRCDIYAILEHREGETKTELAKAQFSEIVTFPEYVYKDLVFTYTDSTLEPTHISVVMTSSAEGNSFKGAIGSTLTVKRIQMMY